ncbi:hypothetical protein DFH09DRAFT_1362327 [Mycena vulgaris]|nr:hypothetical protein DFH09DRAFT_1362327 [Mycena vulgaris]
MQNVRLSTPLAIALSAHRISSSRLLHSTCSWPAPRQSGGAGVWLPVNPPPPRSDTREMTPKKSAPSSIPTPSPTPVDLSRIPRITGATRRIKPIRPFWSKPEQRAVCEHFYRTTTQIAGGFTCAWEEWHGYGIFLPNDPYPSLAIDFYVREFSIPTPIRPLAYLNTTDPCFMFEATGEYYCLNTGMGQLERYGAEFVSDDDFLARHAEVEYVVENLPPDPDAEELRRHLYTKRYPRPSLNLKKRPRP